MATDEEVEAAREVVVELRAQLEQARTGGAENQKSIENDLTLTNLAAEAARLETQLMEARRASSESTAREGAATPLDAAKEEMTRAVSHQKAVAAELTAKNQPGGGKPTSAPKPDGQADKAGNNTTEGAK